MASTPLFSTLPPEIICRVFEFAVDFSVVAALAQTACPFYHTWRMFPASICRAVAPRVLFGLADAERLLDMQEEAEAMGQSQDKPEQRSIIRAKRLLFNARCASAVTKDWIELCEIEASFDRENDPMRPSEIARFQHAFYCVWTVESWERLHIYSTKHRCFSMSAVRASCAHWMKWHRTPYTTTTMTLGLWVLTSRMRFGRWAATWSRHVGWRWLKKGAT